MCGGDALKKYRDAEEVLQRALMFLFNAASGRGGGKGLRQAGHAGLKKMRALEKRSLIR